MKDEYQSFLLRLANLGNGDRAALKRTAGIMLADADGKAVAAFYRCLPHGTPQWQEERWFAVACLRCLWDAEIEGGEPFERIVGRMIWDGELSDSTGHRVEVLLDTSWDEDGYMLTKLTRLVKQIRQKSSNTPVDFSALLEDLIYWNAENQSVQRKWARSIFITET
jgi:CRISPR type I-E-associated protein CasB/Cse2